MLLSLSLHGIHDANKMFLDIFIFAAHFIIIVYALYTIIY